MYKLEVSPQITTQLQNRDGILIGWCYLKSSVLLLCLLLVSCFGADFLTKTIVQTILYLNVSDKTGEHIE